MVASKNSAIKKVPHETKCPMGHFVSWDTFVPFRLSMKVNWSEFVCYLKFSGEPVYNITEIEGCILKFL